jgi:pyrroloquinoline quinone biosynthesis protein B
LQSGIAVSREGDGWVLLNASPDIPTQIERYLFDPSTATRSSPVSNVLLTSANLDHVIGLLLMRENDKPLQVTAPASVRRILCEEFPLGAILSSFCGIEWMDIGADEGKIVGGLLIRCVALKRRKPPRYTKQVESEVVGYMVTDPTTKQTAGFFPDISYVDDDLLPVFSHCDALFLDGTFWSESEMRDLKISQSLAHGNGPSSYFGREWKPDESRFLAEITLRVQIQSYCQTRRNAKRSKSWELSSLRMERR